MDKKDIIALHLIWAASVLVVFGLITCLNHALEFPFSLSMYASVAAGAYVLMGISSGIAYLIHKYVY